VETQHLEADELIFELQVYFGFTHCPDICPDELDKMALMYDKVTEACGKVLLPIMITCDPARDTPKVLKEYLKEFHPEFIGLTGDYEQIKQTCKAYRVYFSTPSSVKPGEDYLVDHSIYFYLMGTLDMAGTCGDMAAR
jgi:protein SCO1/2